MTALMRRRNFIRQLACSAAGVSMAGLAGCGGIRNESSTAENADPGGQLAHDKVPAKLPTRKLPYPPSEILSGLEWLDEPMKYPGTASDMHWWTWGADDALYVIDDDGFNFAGEKSFSHLLRVTGIPPDHKVESIRTFEGLGIRSHMRNERPDKTLRYVAGPVAVGSRLYATVYDYGPDRFERALLSPHNGIAGIMFSDDGGKTWQNVPDEGKPYFLGPRFTALQFIGFGPGYTRVPTSLEGYVYAISNDENWESGNNLFLARVPTGRILERSAWQFYSGTQNRATETVPLWTNEENAARPIFTDPGHVGHSSMTYNAHLKRYLLAAFSDTVPHLPDTPREKALQTWDVETELQIYEGPNPWGPWGLIHGERPWGGSNHACYLPHIPAKWLSEDGLSGTLLFSGDWYQQRYKREYYGFMTQPFRFIERK